MNTHTKRCLIAGLAGIAFIMTAVAVEADWSAPLNPPPTCPSGQAGCDAPLNVGDTTQTKMGSLEINSGEDGSYAPLGLLVHSDTLLQGNAEIDGVTRIKNDSYDYAALFGGDCIVPGRIGEDGTDANGIWSDETGCSLVVDALGGDGVTFNGIVNIHTIEGGGLSFLSDAHLQSSWFIGTDNDDGNLSLYTHNDCPGIPGSGAQPACPHTFNFSNEGLLTAPSIRISPASIDSRPSCGSGTAGQFWYQEAGTDDSLQICVKSSGSYSWKTVSLN